VPHILIASDGAADGMFIKWILEDLGYMVSTVGEPDQWLPRANIECPDLILLDTRVGEIEAKVLENSLRIPVKVLPISDLQGAYAEGWLHSNAFKCELETSVTAELTFRDVSEKVIADKPRVLIVDDSLYERTVLEMMLEEQYDTHSVKDGHQCLAYVHDSPPDLVVLDVMMAGMNGSETCNIIKTLHTTMHIPVVLISSMSSVDYDEGHGELLADVFMQKPIEEEILLEVVERLLNPSVSNSIASQPYIKNATTNAPSTT